MCSLESCVVCSVEEGCASFDVPWQVFFLRVSLPYPHRLSDTQNFTRDVHVYVCVSAWGAVCGAWMHGLLLMTQRFLPYYYVRQIHSCLLSIVIVF